MSSHVGIGQFHSNGKKTSGKDNSHNFQSNDVGFMGPRTWIEEAKKIWANENPNGSTENNFIDKYLSAEDGLINVLKNRNGQTFSLARRETMENLKMFPMISKTK
jgi:hypothetical protein